MAELGIDQTNLPRVQEVCQCFAVLEDGVLAHNLQEQEIEQYYTTNIQKNQLVQNDIRVAKRLQDEEEEQRTQQSALLRQASRQLEEEDFEYARIIQEEIQRRAEEALRREQDDEEIAKRMQEEEQQRIRRRSRGQEDHAEGASLQSEPGEESLDLGELQQVLEDAELARKLQEEEEKLWRRNSQPSPCSSYPEGDFRVAQVAQDEEIAHFMQKQEIKSKRRSRELEGPSSWREHRAMMSHHDRRAARDRQARERLDSAGLPSPTEDCSPENQPPSPTSNIPQAQQIRNIAEELDPTFQARRQGTESLRVEQTGSSPLSHVLTQKEQRSSPQDDRLHSKHLPRWSRPVSTSRSLFHSVQDCTNSPAGTERDPEPTGSQPYFVCSPDLSLRMIKPPQRRPIQGYSNPRNIPGETDDQAWNVSTFTQDTRDSEESWRCLRGAHPVYFGHFVPPSAALVSAHQL